MATLAPLLSAYKPPRFIAGLDVGQQSDPSALAVLQWELVGVEGQFEPRWDVRHLERIPLQTAYPAMARGVRDRLEKLRARSLLVIDATAVGLAVVQHFEDIWMDYDPVLGTTMPTPGKPGIVAVTFTGGQFGHTKPHADSWNRWYVPKRDIVMALVLALQERRFQVATGLAEAATLFKEGQNFQWRVSKAGNDLYGAWREGQHDDLLLAVAIAVWWGQHYVPRVGATSHETRYARGAGNPLVRAPYRGIRS